MSATYSKLKSGDWGVRSTRKVSEGDTVTVTKKDGTKKQETISKVVWSGNGVWLCAIGTTAKSSYTPRAGKRSYSRTCSVCGGNEENQVDCGECA